MGQYEDIAIYIYIMYKIDKIIKFIASWWSEIV